MDEFFKNAYEQANTTEVEEVTQPPTEEQVEEPVQTDVAPQEEVVQVTEPTNDKIVVEGVGEFTLDEFKEMRSGYMRQSDYTKKTQELAKMRKELEEARNTAQATPQQQQRPIQQNYQNPFEERLAQLEQSMADRALDDEITRLKQQYPDFDEVKVLNEAYNKGLTDLEMVYKSTREITPVDMDAIKTQLRNEIMQEIQQNKEITSTVVSTTSAPIQASKPELSAREQFMAKEFGISEEAYLKNKY